MPERYETRLRFNKCTNILKAGFAYSNIRFNTSNAFDVDPVLGSTNTPGFSELSGLYRRYRVHNAVCTVRFTNQEVFGLIVYIQPVNADPGADSTSYQTYLSNPMNRKAAVGAVAGAGTHVEKMSLSPQMFGGSSDLKIDDTYSALTNAGPTNGVWLMVGVYAPIDALTNGVTVSVDIDLDIDFYEVATPAA